MDPVIWKTNINRIWKSDHPNIIPCCEELLASDLPPLTKLELFCSPLDTHKWTGGSVISLMSGSAKAEVFFDQFFTWLQHSGLPPQKILSALKLQCNSGWNLGMSIAAYQNPLSTKKYLAFLDHLMLIDIDQEELQELITIHTVKGVSFGMILTLYQDAETFKEYFNSLKKLGFTPKRIVQEYGIPDAAGNTISFRIARKKSFAIQNFLTSLEELLTQGVPPKYIANMLSFESIDNTKVKKARIKETFSILVADCQDAKTVIRYIAFLQKLEFAGLDRKFIQNMLAKKDWINFYIYCNNKNDPALSYTLATCGYLTEDSHLDLCNSKADILSHIRTLPEAKKKTALGQCLIKESLLGKVFWTALFLRTPTIKKDKKLKEIFILYFQQDPEKLSQESIDKLLATVPREETQITESTSIEASSSSSTSATSSEPSSTKKITSVSDIPLPNPNVHETAFSRPMQRYLKQFKDKPKPSNSVELKQLGIAIREEWCDSCNADEQLVMDTPVKLHFNNQNRFDLNRLLLLPVQPDGSRLHPITHDPFQINEIQPAEEIQKDIDHAIEMAIAKQKEISTASTSSTSSMLASLNQIPKSQPSSNTSTSVQEEIDLAMLPNVPSDEMNRQNPAATSQENFVREASLS